MRFIILHRTNAHWESGAAPGPQLVARVGALLGEMSQATVFNDDPAAQARAFEAQGFKYLHIVDLNGAFAGKPAKKTRTAKKTTGRR